MTPAGARRTPLTLLDWFLAPKLRTAPVYELRRARVLAGCSLLMQAMLLLVGIDSLRRGLPAGWAAVAGVGVWASVLVFLRLGRDRVAGVWIASYMQLAMLFVVLHRDSTFLVFDPWQGVLIMAALYLVGTRFGAVALGVVIVEMIAIPLLGRWGWLLEAPFLRNSGASAPESMAAFFAIFGLGWLYASAKDDTTVALQAALGTLSESREQYRLIAEGTDAIPFAYDMTERTFRYVGPQAQHVFGWPMEDWSVPAFIDRIISADEEGRLRSRLQQAAGTRVQLECRARAKSGKPLVLRLIATLRYEQGTPILTGLILDITELRRLESELRQALKLESVGRLSEGVAHEINTPVQFTADSVHFIQGALRDLIPLLGRYRQLESAVAKGQASPELARELATERESGDLDYVLEHLPRALDRSLEGLDRVADIVRSMREFAHPDEKEMAPVDLNRAVENTLTVSRGEYKLVADIETKLGAVPPVFGYASELNQVLLNLIVNAAHAIEDVVSGTDKKGQIHIETAQDGDAVTVSIRDTGAGIPEAIRERIFDPFFTTKEVGRGVGQGLVIARSVVQDKHGGQLTFTSEVGVGTTFTIRLPIEGKPAPSSN